MKRNLLLLSCLLFIGNVCIAQTWSAGADLPLPVRGGNATAYASGNNGYFIIVSGRKENGAIVKTVQRYTAGTNTWDTLKPHPTGLLGAGTTTLKDSLYLVGGVVNPPGFGQTKVYKYSIAENTWTEVAPYPFATVDAKAVGYKDSLIYATGGLGGPDSGNVCLYNAHTNSWRRATPLPITGRINFGGFAVCGDTLVYVCGTDGLFSPNYFNKVYTGSISTTDRAQITWSEGTPFPGSTRSFFDAHTWGKRGIILTGGSTDNTFNTPSDECYTYNPATALWTAHPAKPSAWLTGQSGSFQLPDGTWKLICAGGFKTSYLTTTEIFSETQPPTGAGDQHEGKGSFLYQNIPNPFRSTTVISYDLKNAGPVTIQLHNLSGTAAQTLLQERQTAGTHNLNFSRAQLSAGIYYYTLHTGRFRQTRSMVIVN